MRARGRQERESDNVDLSGGEHAWWTGSRPTATLASANPAAEPTATTTAHEAAPPLFVEDFDRRESAVPPWNAVGADPWQRSASPEVTEAYRALGIDWDASWAEVVDEYRKLARKWHPDRLANATPAVQAEGQRRMSEFNLAYRELRGLLRHERRSTLFSS